MSKIDGFYTACENIKENNFKNITTINAAISDVTGQGTINDHTLSKVSKTNHAKQTQNCNLLSIDDLLEKYQINDIDFLKMDVEGSEFLIFQKTSWLDKVKIIVMEAHQKYGNVSQIVNTLEKKGFNVNKIFNGNTYYVFAKR